MLCELCSCCALQVLGNGLSLSVLFIGCFFILPLSAGQTRYTMFKFGYNYGINKLSWNRIGQVTDKQNLNFDQIAQMKPIYSNQFVLLKITKKALVISEKIMYHTKYP